MKALKNRTSFVAAYGEDFTRLFEAGKVPAGGTALEFTAGVPVKKFDIVKPGVWPASTSMARPSLNRKIRPLWCRRASAHPSTRSATS